MKKFIKVTVVIVLASIVATVIRKYFGETYNIGWYSGIAFATAVQTYSYYLNDNE